MGSLPCKALSGLTSITRSPISSATRPSISRPTTSATLFSTGSRRNCTSAPSATACRATRSYRLSDSHTIRAGFFGFTENVESDNTSSVFPVDANGNVTGGPFNIRDDSSKNGNTYGALYLQDEWKALDKLTVNYGLRADEMDAFVKAGQLSPRLGLVYKATHDTTLHAAYARYFTPPPTELVSPKDLALFEGTSNAPSVTAEFAGPA